MIIWNLECKYAAGASTPISNSTRSLFFCPLSFKKYLNLRIRINKMVNEHSVDNLSSGYVNSYFYRLLKALSLSRIFVECFVKPAYPTMVVENFRIHGVQINGKCIC